MNKKRQIFLLLFFLTLAFILRVNNLSQRSLWTDEFFTFFQSTGHGLDIKNFLDYISKNPSPMLLRAKEFKVFLKNDPTKNIKDVGKGLLNTDTHPPLYFWIMYLWMRIFGDGVLAVRFFSVLMGMLTIFLAYQVGKYLFNRNCAIFSALFVSFSAFAVRYSQEARPYSLIMTLGLSTWLFILRFEKHNRNLDVLWFAVLNCLGIYTHYFYIFIAFSQFAYFTIAHRNNTSLLRKFYLAFLYSLLFLLPWFTLITLQGYNFHLVGWIFGYPGIINKIYNLFVGIASYILIFDTSNILPRALLLIGLFLFTYIAFRALKDIILIYRKQFLFSLVMFLIPLLCMFFIDIIQHAALLRQERFWVFPFLGFIPLAGYFLNYSFLKNRLVTYLVILLMLISSIAISNSEFGPAPKYISVWINRESHGKTSAVFVYNTRSVVFPQAYYLNNDIYLIPVSDYGQLKSAIKVMSNYVDKIFIARHYHRTDTSLMNNKFMEIKNIDSGFKLKTTIDRDYISVSEYVK